MALAHNGIPHTAMPRLRWLHEDDVGPMSARNRGFAHDAVGEIEDT